MPIDLEGTLGGLMALELTWMAVNQKALDLNLPLLPHNHFQEQRAMPYKQAIDLGLEGALVRKLP